MILSEKSSNFIKAFFEVRSLISGKVEKNTANNHLKSKYADLGSVFKAITPALEEGRIAPIQSATMVMKDEITQVEVVTVLMHESGESATFTSCIPLAKADAHGFGSAFTYARRYSLMGIFGLVPADDDGNATRRTAKDVKRMLDRAEDVPAMNKIMETSVQYFADDIASLNVIRAHYDKLKADMVVGNAEPFRPLQPKQKPQQQSDKTESPKGDNIEPEINF